jgi:hypothetical protein
VLSFSSLPLGETRAREQAAKDPFPQPAGKEAKKDKGEMRTEDPVSPFRSDPALPEGAKPRLPEFFHPGASPA